MFENAISQIKNQGLITQNDIVVACFDASKVGAGQFWGGAIGAAIAKAAAKRFVLAADERSIRIFEIDETNGAYLDVCTQFMKSEIKKAKVNNFFGTYGIVIKTQTGRFPFQTSKKFHRFHQKEELIRLKEFLKVHYQS